MRLFFCVVSFAFMVSGCASLWFPDFEDADKEVVVDDGGKVQVHEVKEKGILVADKENAAYEDDEENADEGEKKIEPAKVVEVKASEEGLGKEDTVKTVEEPFTGEVKSAVKADNVVKEVSSHSPSMHYLAQTVYFENGGSSVSVADQKGLKALAELARKNKAMVTVYGFASSRTRNTDPVTHKLANFKISVERANSVAKLLRRYGVDASRINVHALSDSMPLYREVMPEGERLNRRAEIYLTY